MRKKVISSALSLAITSSMLLSPFAHAEGRNIEDPRKQNPISMLSEMELAKYEQFMARHSVKFVRGGSCPMSSSKYGDILKKIDNIKALFKSTDCAEDPTELDKILNGLDTAKDGIKDAATTAGVDTTAIQTAAQDATTSVDGEQVATAMNGINNLFLKSKCNLDKGTVLERGADMIQNFSQLGLLVPNANGLVIAGGGIAASSLLRMISALFDKKFDFTDNGERKSFIKLNCAFYDIRREIESSGMVDIALPEHKIDSAEIKVLLAAIDKKAKGNKDNYDKILKVIGEQQNADVKKAMKVLVELDGTVKSGKKILETPAVDETAKMNAILKLLTVSKKLKTQIEAYLQFSLDRVDAFDALLDSNLSELSEPKNLIQMSAKDFNNGYRAIMLAHFQRIEGDIASEKVKQEKLWQSETTIGGKTIAAYKKDLAADFKKINTGVAEKKGKMSPVSTRLEQILKSDTRYTMADDGEDNTTAVLSSYDDIVEQVYGKWGFIFLDEMSNSSIEVNKIFKEKFNNFAKDFLIVSKDEKGKTTYKVRTAKELKAVHPAGDLAVTYACQDARPYRRLWVEADSYSQNAYDFLATNKDLFHSDIPRVFFGKSGNRHGIHKMRSKFEHIQRHHKSTIFAKRASALSDEEAKKDYLKSKKDYLVIRKTKKKYAGMTMLDMNESIPMVQALQRVTELYKCTELSAKDDN